MNILFIIYSDLRHLVLPVISKLSDRTLPDVVDCQPAGEEQLERGFLSLTLADPTSAAPSHLLPGDVPQQADLVPGDGAGLVRQVGEGGVEVPDVRDIQHSHLIYIHRVATHPF